MLTKTQLLFSYCIALQNVLILLIICKSQEGMFYLFGTLINSHCLDLVYIRNSIQMSEHMCE